MKMRTIDLDGYKTFFLGNVHVDVNDHRKIDGTFGVTIWFFDEQMKYISHKDTYLLSKREAYELAIEYVKEYRKNRKSHS